MDEVKNNMQKFLLNEIWLLSFAGAFQHVRIYQPEVKEKQRERFRIELKKYITSEILPQYKQPVSETQHMQNLESIIQFSEGWGEYLNGEKLNIGVSQKLLNLLLKYLWCLGHLAEPPHCPVDRIVQTKGLQTKQPINWTTLNSSNDYLDIIYRIKQVAKEKSLSIAEWELEVFSRTREDVKFRQEF